MTPKEIELLKAVQAQKRDDYVVGIKPTTKNRMLAAGMIRVRGIDRFFDYEITPKGEAALLVVDMGLTEPQAYRLEQANKPGGTYVGGGGPAAMVERMVKAGMLRWLDDHKFQHETTDQGRAALKLWREAGN